MMLVVQVDGQLDFACRLVQELAGVVGLLVVLVLVQLVERRVDERRNGFIACRNQRCQFTGIVGARDTGFPWAFGLTTPRLGDDRGPDTRS